MTPAFSDVTAALAAHGFACRGAFHPRPDDEAPALPDGRPAATLVLAGNAGPGMWRAFERSARADAHPLDAWSRAGIGTVAEAFGAAAVFPGDGPPWLPFLRWARRAGPLHHSAIGILIHPDYGLWHGYRGALAFAGRLDLPPADDRPSPCDACADKPCLSTCPVAAFTPDGYDVAGCVSHLGGPAGADCMELGCRARRACPVGREFAYAPAQAEFHMRAFRRANRG